MCIDTRSSDQWCWSLGSGIRARREPEGAAIGLGAAEPAIDSDFGFPAALDDAIPLVGLLPAAAVVAVLRLWERLTGE